MIKVAISGADTPQAGELIRILVNHPDVEIVSLVAPGHEGQTVQSVHHGLLGEEKISFSGTFRPEKADVLFVADNLVKASDVAKLREAFPDLKVILLNTPENDTEDLSPELSAHIFEEDLEDYSDYPYPVFALPEINRKPLVRGAKAALIPSPVTSLALVPLYPLALHMLLAGDIEINISGPADLLEERKLKESADIIAHLLNKAQKSFNGKISFITSAPTSKRGVELFVSLPSPLDIEHIMKAYEVYEDHNFSFPVITSVKLDDVKGTEKIVFSLSVNKDRNLDVHAVADGRLRGNAGEAVHVLNLMFGLHEKTGLYLKPYAY